MKNGKNLAKKTQFLLKNHKIEEIFGAKWAKKKIAILLFTNRIFYDIIILEIN